MSVSIRLSRGGAKKRAFFHIVAADKRFSRDGRYLEAFGYLNLNAASDEMTVFIELDRVQHWVSNGAKPTDRVRSLIKLFKQLPTAEEQKKSRDAKQAAAEQRLEAKKAAKAKAQLSANSESSDGESSEKEAAESAAKEGETDK